MDLSLYLGTTVEEAHSAANIFLDFHFIYRTAHMNHAFLLLVSPILSHPSCPCISLHPPSLLQAGGQGRLKPIQCTLYFCVTFLNTLKKTHTHPTPFTAAYCTHSRPTSGGRWLCPPKLTRKQKQNSCKIWGAQSKRHLQVLNFPPSHYSRLKKT